MNSGKVDKLATTTVLGRRSGARHPIPVAWASAAARLGRWLWPLRCLVCGEPGAEGLDLCAACQACLPVNSAACARCALPTVGGGPVCGACQGTSPPVGRTRAPFRYAFPLDRLVPRFKFHEDLACGRLLAELCLPTLAAADRPQALVPVPLHRARLRQRGYDQALELAKVWSRALAVPLRADLLQRSRPTAAQSGLDARARRRNIRGAFAVRPAVEVPAFVALVDDVMTTGATLEECARALRAAGAQRVDVWVVARALPRSPADAAAGPARSPGTRPGRPTGC